MNDKIYDIVRAINHTDNSPMHPAYKLLLWEESTECSDSCVIHDHCKLRSIDFDTGEFSPCTLRIKYANQIAKTLMHSIPKLTTFDHHKIGTLLMPIYSQLLDYQILLSHYKKDMVKNYRTIDSINKSVRDITKTLISSLKDISGEGDGPNSKSKLLDGDPDYYDNLINKTGNG